MSQGFTRGVPIDTDPTLSLDSDLVVPSQKAIKAYVDNQDALLVSGVTATAPLTSSGGTAPVLSTSMNTDKLIGRGTAGAGVMEEITLGTGLDLAATTLNVTNIDPAVLAVTETSARLDNWAPAGWPGTVDKIKVIQLTANYVDKVQIISGLGSGVGGRTVTLSNTSTDNLVILELNSTNSLAANRFKFLGRGAFFLFPGDDITFIYNGTQWSQLGGSLKNGFTLFDDFGGPNNTGTAPNQSYFGEAGYGQASGTGSLVRNEAATINSMGTIGLTTGTLASGYATIKMNGRSANGVFGSVTTTLSQFAVVTRFALNTLPTVAQDYRFQTGLCANSNANSVSLTGLMGWYCSSGNANWKCYTSTTAGGLVSDVTSGLVVSTNVIVLGTYHPNILGDTVFFYSSDGGMTYTVDNRFVRVSNVYGGAPVVGIGKTAGLISVTVDNDYIGLTLKGSRI